MNRRKRTEKVTKSREGSKFLSKNALVARENRLKKKHYIHTLEKDVSSIKEENNKLKQLVTEQKNTIKSLQSNVLYLKSVLANSSEISRLLKCVQDNSGLPMTSSLVSSQCVSKEFTNKPVSETCMSPPSEESSKINTLPTQLSDPEYQNVSSAMAWTDDDDGSLIANDVPLSMAAIDDIFPCTSGNGQNSLNLLQDEHNYFSSSETDESLTNAGVCIHISNKKLSLEFCSVCSANALSAWEDSFFKSLSFLPS